MHSNPLFPLITFIYIHIQITTIPQQNQLTMNSKNSFKLFLQSWLESLNSILTRLECVPLDKFHEAEHRDLVLTFMKHQECLFEGRRELVKLDPFLGVCSPGGNFLSRALEWCGGWRPVAAFGVAKCCRVVQLEQETALKAMRLTTKMEEAAIEREKLNIEIDVIKAFVKGKYIEPMETSIMATMERVAVLADMARMEAVNRIVNMLAPAKAVVYLTGLGKMETEFYTVQELPLQVSYN